MRKAAALLLMASCALAAHAAGEDPNGGKSTGPVALLPAPAALVRDGLPAGGLHLPGREYRSGTGWWALACRSGCELLSLKLDVSARQHPQYDGDPVPGQLLAFAPLPPEATLLIMKPLRAPAERLALQAGPVTTWFPAIASRLKRSTLTEGTMESELALPDGRTMRFVPVLQTAPQAVTGREWIDGEGMALELMFDGKRQKLGAFTFGIDGLVAVKPSDFIMWAGDLDRDGKPDLILNLSLDGSTQRVLFLSSLAKPGEIVGEAGSFNYFPIDLAGC